MTSAFWLCTHGNWNSNLGSESGRCWKMMRIFLRMKWTKPSRPLMGTSYPVTGSSQRTQQVSLTESFVVQSKNLIHAINMLEKHELQNMAILLPATSLSLLAVRPGRRSHHCHWSRRGGWHQEGPEKFEFPLDGWWWAPFILHSAHPWGHRKVASQDAQHNLLLRSFGGSTGDCGSVPFINGCVVYLPSANTVTLRMSFHVCPSSCSMVLSEAFQACIANWWSPCQRWGEDHCSQHIGHHQWVLQWVTWFYIILILYTL